MHLMGERQGWGFAPTFNRSIKIRQADPKISENAGGPGDHGDATEPRSRPGQEPALTAHLTGLESCMMTYTQTNG